MRIAIREQLVALVLIVALISLAGVSISTWVTNRSFVLSIRSARLTLTASLKASQLATTLAALQNAVRLTATRIRLQQYCLSYTTNNITQDLRNDAITDLRSALSSYDGTQTGVQAALFALDPSSSTYSSILNVSSDDFTAPYPILYPNFTYDGNTTYFNNIPYTASSSLLLGPVAVNDSFGIMSITLPVISLLSQSTADVLGWVTIVTNAAMVYEVTDSLEGLGNTGTVLLVGPNNPDNRFGPGILYDSPTRNSTSQDTLDNTLAKFVFPPPELQYDDKRHPARDEPQDFGIPYPLKAFPAVEKVVSQNQSTINNAGSWLKTHNEQGYNVGVGYALANTTLVDWVVVIEWAHAEIWQPITHLRNILLACVFATVGFQILLVWPIAHVSIRPIRRLQLATLNTVDAPEGDNEEAKPRTSISVVEVSPSVPGSTGNSSNDASKSSTLVPWSALHFGQSEKVRNPKTSQHSGTFRIPSHVKDKKHYVQDELTDLTKTFNEMTDELSLQYERLEERVRKRTAELELSKRAAEAANESKTLFIANVSHELKTPLNGILGMCAVCMHETDLGKIKQSLSIMYKSGDLLLTLLTDLLTFSKNQAGQEMTLESKAFKLKDISTQLKAIFENQAKSSGIDFQIAYEGRYDSQGQSEDVALPLRKYGPPGTGKVKNMRCRGDMHRVLQVAINLVSNALKFTPADGSVKLTIRCCAESPHQSTPSRKSSQQSVGSKKLLPQLKMLASRRGSVADPSRASQKNLARAEAESITDTNGSQASFQPVMNSADGTVRGSETFWFEFEVKDTGLGIPSHLQAQIFEPFVQGDLRLTKKYGGTGLGLSICAQLAKMMNGTISVNSEPGQGSTFIFRIPLDYLGLTNGQSNGDSSFELSRSAVGPDFESNVSKDMDAIMADDAIKRASIALTRDFDGKTRLLGLGEPLVGKVASPVSSPDSEIESRDSKLRVLVAEDNQVNQEVVLRMLKLEEVFNVEIAKDGQEAFDKVKESTAKGEPYDLIFMDVQMPNLDGRESTRLIREHGFKSPIVALSAFSDEINQRECIESGMDYFLAKPIKRPALRSVLTTYCPTIYEQDEGESPSPKSRPARSRKGTSEIKPLDLNKSSDEAKTTT